jgi:hypothetical protein
MKPLCVWLGLRELRSETSLLEVLKSLAGAMRTLQPMFLSYKQF